MKKELSRVLKRITLSIIVLSLAVIGFCGPTVDTSAAEVVKTETSGVIYVQYTDMDYTEYWTKKAPEYTGVDSNGVGYLFGGWYTKSGDKYNPVTNVNELTGTVVAKFVPAQTLSVKCQNPVGTVDSTDDVIVRIISAVDSTNYNSFGFVVSKIVDGVEKQLGTKEDDTVYSVFNYYKTVDDEEPTKYYPSDLFGKAAGHFISKTVGRIPTSAHGTIICIKPFWKTFDGITVYGLSKFAHVEDGYLGYVNVPVNLNILNKDNGAAVGRLDVQSNDSLEFIGAEDGIEHGKVFDEMEFNVLSDGTIRCIGDTSTLTDKNEMDVFVNLKFRRKESTDEPAKSTFYTFKVDNEDFCNAAEELFEGEDVWNIIY